MTIQEYIKKHGLNSWRKYPDERQSHFGDWMPAMFLMGDGDDSPKDDTYEVFANTEHTHFVSLNKSRQLFRIVHHELIPVMSKWEPSTSNFVLQPV